MKRVITILTCLCVMNSCSTGGKEPAVDAAIDTLETVGQRSYDTIKKDSVKIYFADTSVTVGPQ